MERDRPVFESPIEEILARALLGRKQAYNIKEASDAFGVSRDVITRAINAGDLVTLDPRVDGKSVKVRLIAAHELWRWMRNESRV